MKSTVVGAPQAGINASYASNQPPLVPGALAKLPIGSIKPKGWLKHQLDLMVTGMTGRLGELSEFLHHDNGWLGGDREGWEEQGYWFRGFHDLAVLTGNPQLLAEANRWLEAMIGWQDSEGYFGARHHKAMTGKNGQTVTDLWPHMVMLDAIISHHEHTGDARIVPMLTRFFQFCRDLPDDRFVPALDHAAFGDWKPTIQRDRAGDVLPHIYWLYNHTREPWLLDLATRFFQHVRPPENEFLDVHVVHFTQRFSYPGRYYVQAGEPWRLQASEYWYGLHMAAWGQQPRGIFAADECTRTGRVDPRQGFETCGMVEFNKSFYLLGRITGNPIYGDRCEDVTLNHFPAASTPDLKALHYLTASNQPQLDRSTNHKYFNEETQHWGNNVVYSPYRYRCCQHNVAMGWPWYAQNLWQATGDNGLAAWMYAACDVTAKVAGGVTVWIEENTDYPFSGNVELRVRASRPVSFPLYLRVPRWCSGFFASVNGRKVKVDAPPGSFIRIERTWKRTETVDIEMPMEFGLTTWPRTGAVTVDRGPLSYSVKIDEQWNRCGGTDEWPEWEVLPKSPWNYGLLIDRANPAASLQIAKEHRVPDQPWTVDAAPIELTIPARRIPEWGLENETVQELPPSPVRSDQPDERITMIPMGCARLRMACLPVIRKES